MPTAYDAFTRAAWPSTGVQDPEVRRNRAKLIAVMEENGFRVNASEWWHFDFQGWKLFEVLDIDFSELSQPCTRLTADRFSRCHRFNHSPPFADDDPSDTRI